MLFKLIKFECFYQLKQVSFWAFSLVFFSFGCMVGRNIFAGLEVMVNSSFQIAYHTGLLSLGIVFSIMFHVVTAVLRDHKSGFESILFSTPLSKQNYFISRFAGVFVAACWVMVMGMLGFALGTASSDVSPERILAFDFFVYLKIYLILVLPTVFILSSVIFTLSLLTRSALAAYTTAVAIYGLYWLCAMYFNSPMLAQAVPADPDNLIIAALADPFGLSAFFEQTQYWNVFEKNNNAFSFTGNFRRNRLIWIGVAGLILIAAFWKFSFRQGDSKQKKALEKETRDTLSKSYQSVAVRVAGRSFHRAGLITLLKINTKYLLKSLPFIATLLIWLVVLITEIYNAINRGGYYRENIYPTTSYLIDVISQPLPFIALVLIVFYSGELVWRERDLKFYSIVDAGPTANATFFLSKLIPLLAIPFILIAMGILVALSFQITKDFTNVEPKLWLTLFYFGTCQTVFFALLALFVQSWLPHKYLGMLVSGLVILLLSTSMSGMLGFDHPLLQVGRFPALIHTDMNGFGDYARRFHHFSFYWLSLGLLLTLVSFKIWRRGNVSSFLVRLKYAVSSIGQWQYLLLALSVVIFICTGAKIYYHTNVEQEFLSVQEQLDLKEAYELNFKQYENLARLHVNEMKTRVDIFPEKGSYQIKADYILVNKNEVPVNKMLLTERVLLENVKIEKARLVERDSALGIWLFEFENTVMPGEQLEYSYEIAYQQKGLEVNNDILANGSYIGHLFFEPTLRYRNSKEIKDAHERQKRGLPELEEETVVEDHLHTDEPATAKMPFETIVSTTSNQTAIAPGKLIRNWKEADRNYYHYRTEGKVAPLIAYISAAYECRLDTFRGIQIEQYYHAEHHYNVEKIEGYARSTLAYCIDNFGPYPFDQLRIAEIPAHWYFGGQALPGTISMVADRLYLVDLRDSMAFDLVAKRTIHEIAHQWWGHLLTPKNVDGGSLITEGLAKYTEAVLLEKLFGKRALRQISETAANNYFSRRALVSSPEPPLYLSHGEAYLSYGKSLSSFMALEDMIGEDSINKVLRLLVQRYRTEAQPEVVTTELLDELYRVSPPETHSLIDDWFKRVITYDLALEEVQTKELEGRKYELTLTVKARRLETGADGDEHEIAINELIPIGVFMKPPDQLTDDSDILYLEPHLINANEMEIKIVVDQEPEYILIDPYGTRLEENRMDNSSD